MNPFLECRSSVTRQNRHLLRRKDRPVVNSLIRHEVHHDTGVIKSAAFMSGPGVIDGVCTWKRSGKGRVQVHDHVGKAIKKGRGEQMHPTGLHDEIGASISHLGSQRSVVRLSRSSRVVGELVAERTHRPMHGSNAGGLGPLSGERAPAVHDNEDDLSLERARLACVEDGLQI